MRSVVFHGPGEIQLEDCLLPIPMEGEVRLSVLLAGICSTDLHIVQGHFAVRPPRILGHELVGVVDALGPGVPQSWLGQVCGIRPARFCGGCTACRNGAPELCTNFECLGNTHDGGFAETTLAHLDQLVPLGVLPPMNAVWLEPLACVLHAIQVAAPAASAPVLVLGAGVYGKLLVQTLRATTGARIAIVDPNPSKIEQALAQGAEAGWTVPRSGLTPEVDLAMQNWAPDGLKAVIDTTGAPAAIERALEWAGPKARVVLFGVSDPAASLSIHPNLIFIKEITLTATAGMTPASFEAAEKLLRLRKLDLEALVAKTVPLEEVPGLLLDRSSMQAGKVLVRPGDNGK